VYVEEVKDLLTDREPRPSLINMSPVAWRSRTRSRRSSFVAQRPLFLKALCCPVKVAGALVDRAVDGHQMRGEPGDAIEGTRAALFQQPARSAGAD